MQSWAERRWDSLATILTTFTSTIAKYFDADVEDASKLSEAISGIAKDSGSVQEPAYILAKAVEFARCFGFSGLLVQVDKVDETDWTNSDPKAAANLVWPLYSNILFHEINGLSWSFFIWDRVRDLLNEENEYPVRWDKLTNRRIKWDDKYLRNLVEKRIEFYSDGKLKKLIDIFDDNLNEKLIYQELIKMSGYSPRHLINILNAILMDHIQTNEDNVCLISQDSLDKGLDSYAQDTLLDQYSTDTLSQIKKLGKTEFINKDVTRVFSISGPGAKQKIDKWIKIGIANRAGQIFAGDRVKPVDKFVISDQRIKRLIERDLDVML